MDRIRFWEKIHLQPAPTDQEHWPHDADAQRRARNVLIIALGLTGVCLVMLISALIRMPSIRIISLLGGGAASSVVISLLANWGRVQLAALLLVVTPLLLVVLAVIDHGQLRSAPYFCTVSLIIAGMTMRARGVGLTFICALATLAVLGVLSANIPQVLPPPGSQVLNAALLTGIAALVSMLGASSAAASLIALQIRERQARQAKQALCESEERYRLIAENTSDLIALLDAEGRYLYASPSFARELGHMPAALVGARRYDLIHPDDLPLALAYWHQARRRGGAQSSYRVRHANGEWRWLEVCLTTATQQGREYIILVARDITARRAIEAQLQQAQKLQALGHLATGVAHDFNNLLVVINGGVELAAAVLPADHPAQGDLNAVQQASKRASALTHQLLALARRQPTTPRLVQLGDVIRENGQMLERLMGEAITLVINVASDGWPVWADPSQIEQVLMNLAVNARDAMPEGGTLAISVANSLRFPIERADIAPIPYVCMTITDTGVGISQEVERHLFEPFYTTKAPEKGTGLGLAICYGIVTQAGGEITVSSAVGAGTTFTILLPRAADRPDIDSSLTGHDDSARPPRGPLVAEDETAVRPGSDPARRAHAQLQSA